MKRAKLQNHPDTLLSFFSQLKSAVMVAVEATWNWYWLQELFDDHHIPMKLVQEVINHYLSAMCSFCRTCAFGHILDM